MGRSAWERVDENECMVMGLEKPVHRVAELGVRYLDLRVRHY
jgi:hypothetical protein